MVCTGQLTTDARVTRSQHVGEDLKMNTSSTLLGGMKHGTD